MGSEHRSFGKYAVLARLGRGGMGEVHLAMNLGPAGVQKLVVVKQLREDLATSPVARAMFLDEARIAALLHHPNIVQTYEVGDEGDDLYIVMEYLEGRSLARIVDDPAPASLTLAMRLRILSDVLRALHYAHELADYEGRPLGVVHRDVSPPNIFVTYDGHVKLVDFGIAKAANATAHSASGAFKGKVRHAAPEQALGLAVDRRADVYSVGTVLWEALAGARMWRDVPEAEVIEALAAGAIPSPRTVRRDVPEVLEAICMRALSRDPARRYATASEMRHAIVEYLRSIGDATSEQHIAAALDAAFGAHRRAMQTRIEARIRATREAGPPSSGSGTSGPHSVPRWSVDSLAIPTPPSTQVPISPRTAPSDAPIAPSIRPETTKRAPLGQLAPLAFGLAIGATLSAVAVTRFTRDASSAHASPSSAAAAATCECPPLSTDAGVDAE